MALSRNDAATKDVQIKPKKEGVCRRHGAKNKKCRSDGCTNEAQIGGSVQRTWGNSQTMQQRRMHEYSSEGRSVQEAWGNEEIMQPYKVL